MKMKMFRTVLGTLKITLITILNIFEKYQTLEFLVLNKLFLDYYGYKNI